MYNQRDAEGRKQGMRRVSLERDAEGTKQGMHV